MKKSVISLALCLSLLIGMMSVMFVLPTSAAGGVDFLDIGSINSCSDGATAEIVNGTLVFTATATGQEVALGIENEANLNDYPYFKGVIESDVPFDIAWYDANHTKWMFAAGDFCYNFGDGLQASRPIPAGAYDVEFSLTGAYTWTGDPLPANAAIQSIYIIAKGAGTITVSTCAMTDGMKDIDLNTRGDQSATAWQTRIDLIEGDYYGSPAPSINDPQSHIKVTENADGSVTYGNTNGMWPAANYVFDTPLTVDPSAALDLDFTVQSGCAATIYMFFGPSTPDNFSDGAYIRVANPDDILNSDLPLGHYKGVVFLEDTILKTIGNLNAVDKCYDTNGNLVLTGIKIFATSHSGASDNVVTVNKLHLVSDKITTTTESTTTPTTVPTYAVNGVDFLRGTAQGNDQTPDDAYSLENGTLVFTCTTVGQEVSLTASEEANLNDYPYFEGIIESDVPFDIVFYDANNAKWMFGAGDFCVFFGDVLQPSNPLPAGEYNVKFPLTGVYTWNGDPLPADAAIQSIYIVPKEAGTITVSKCALTDGIGQTEPSLGDLDGDGTTSLSDATQLFFHVNGTAALTDEELLLADVNGDGSVNLTDMAQLFYIINGQL